MKWDVLVAVILLIGVHDTNNIEDLALLVDTWRADGHPLEAGFRDQAHDGFDLTLIHVRDSHE